MEWSIVFFSLEYTGEHHIIALRTRMHIEYKQNIHKHIPPDRHLKHLSHKDEIDPQTKQDQLGLKHEFGRITQCNKVVNYTNHVPVRNEVVTDQSIDSPNQTSG